MLKSLTRPFRALVIPSVLLLIFWLGFPGVAVADKSSKPVVFDPVGTAISGTAIDVVNLYTTTPATPKDVSDALIPSKSFYEKTAGFIGFAVLKREDGAEL